MPFEWFDLLWAKFKIRSYHVEGIEIISVSTMEKLAILIWEDFPKPANNIILIGLASIYIQSLLIFPTFVVLFIFLEKTQWQNSMNYIHVWLHKSYANNLSVYGTFGNLKPIFYVVNLNSVLYTTASML
ncbi:hypothetical protein ACJX0J_030466, partial [Zea mays]